MSDHLRDTYLRGWLRRKGGCMKTWSRRWFVLTEKFLFMFLRDDDKKSQDCTTLSGQIIVEPPLDPNDPQYGFFNIVTENDGEPSTTLYLCADTEEEKKIWVRTLKRVLYAEKGGALFSQSLEEILHWEHAAGRHIPYIVDECVEYLYKYGLDVEGIFRLPGRQSVSKDIIARFERGEKVKFEEEGIDVHVVASVLKTFLRSLPDSIIPCSLFQKFMNIALRYTTNKDVVSRETAVQELAQTLTLIPKDNYIILKYICQFLREVGQHESTNKMSLMSLGTVFSYNFIRHIDNENNQLFLLTADLGQNLIYMLLKYYMQVFIHEYNSQPSIEESPANDSLLRMSRIIDIPVLIPDVSVASPSSDHAGSHIISQSSLDENPVYRKHIGYVHDNLMSTESSRSEFDSDHSVAGDKNPFVHGRKKSLHLSLSADAEIADFLGTTCSSTNLSLNENCNFSSGSLRRSRARIVRSRCLSDRRRPQTIMLNSGVLVPRDMHSPGGINSEDVFNALAILNAPSLNSVSSPFSNSTSLDINCAPSELTLDHSISNTDFNAESSIIDLDNQMTALKEEFSQNRNSHRTQVTALNAQLTDIKEIYESQIETTQTEYRSRITDLQNKLSEEKKSCSDAVVDTLRCQEIINKYQMLYGELS